MDVVDDFYIWQRRIHHGIRYQKDAVPFPESVKIGLEFNAALERKEKLDERLLTNAVMMEICNFGRTVTRSEKYFLFEMLEYNFELDVNLDDDMQFFKYTTWVHSKIKQVKKIRLKPPRLKETFPLPDRLAMASAGSEAPGQYCPRRNKISDTSVLTKGSRSTESNDAKKTKDKTEVTDKAYSFCQELGVSLVVKPDETSKRKLNPNLLTNGVMIELLDFSRVLCGSQIQIVNDLVKQNFGFELDKARFRRQLSKAVERKFTYLTAEDRADFGKETFQRQSKRREQKCRKRKSSEADHQEQEQLTINKRRINQEAGEDSDQSQFMCPIEVRSKNLKVKSCLSGFTAAETKSAASLSVDKEVSSEQTRFNFNLIDDGVSGLFSADKNNNMTVKTQKQSLWVRRAARSQQILKSSRVNDMFARCRQIGLDFNVGSGNKQNLDLRLLTNCVLMEIVKFATAMSKSVQCFLFDFLDKNFRIKFSNERNQRMFLLRFITKGNLATRRKSEVLSRPFPFPQGYNIADESSDFQTETEHPISPATTHLTDVEPNLFCKNLGLNLWSTEERPGSQKLNLSVLTTGAALEILSFVRSLCGDVRTTVNDVLEHNFDLDLENEATEASQTIQRWYWTQKNLMKKQNTSEKINTWLNQVVQLSSARINPESPTGTSPEILKSEDLNVLAASEQVKEKNPYHICREIGLDLDFRSKSETKTKLDLRVLTRGVLFEVHRYVAQHCNRYVPALYEILEYNFDLSSQSHRRVELAWSVASQVIAMARKQGRTDEYMNTVFELPMDVGESPQVVCKDEPKDEEEEEEEDLNDEDVVFVRKLKPVDIEVEVE